MQKEIKMPSRTISKWYYSPLTLRYLEIPFKVYSIYLRQVGYDLKSMITPFRKKDIRLKINSLNIIPTTFCNSRCVFCAHKFLKDKKKTMDFSIAKKAIDEFALLGGKEVSLTPMVGEALIDPGIFRKIEYAKKKGLKVSLYTNAIALGNKGIIEQVLKAGIDELQIDIADINPKYESDVFGIPIKTAKRTINSILELLEQIDKKKINQNLILGFRSSRHFSEIWKELRNSKFMEYYKKGIFTIEYLHAYDNWGGQIKEKDLKGVQRLRKCARIKKYPCGALWSLSILPNGDARLCGCRFKGTIKDELVIGNIKKDSLSKLLKSKKWKSIIQNFESNAPDVCKECSFYTPKFN
jgi:radical SAM protein with 4Fe4S-binding SPASM domain